MATVLVCNQVWNLWDPILNADPLNAVTYSHFLWASVLFGYLTYDTLYSLLFFSWSSGASFLLHHAVGLAGCSLGLFANKLALFGLAIEVFFEATTPLLQLLGCLKLAGYSGKAYKLLGLAFTCQFFLCRVVIANLYFARLAATVVALEDRPWWAWAGVAVFAFLNTLNAYWFVKLVQIAAAGLGKKKKASMQTAAADKGTRGIAQAAAAAAAGCRSPKTAPPLTGPADKCAHDGHLASTGEPTFVIAAKKVEVRAYATDTIKVE
ncbi:hypothetical protein N2152v2_003332 [Parachlorella kessleri]